MCIFSQPVESVNATRIFARLDGQGRQFLAYEMNYESRGPNSMILPVPIRRPAREDSLQFINLKPYGHFFTDLAAGFPFRASSGIGCSAQGVPASAPHLKVHEVGDFIASFVPSLPDFERLDPKFRLPRETWAKLPGSEEFGFAVFQLAPGALKPHPMAFAFQTRAKDLFFPTIHIHDGEVHDAEAFDHVLYLQHAGFDSRVGDYRNSTVEDESTGLVRSVTRASKFCDVVKSSGLLLGNLLVHRKFLVGQLPNRDTWVAAPGDPERAGVNFHALGSYSASLTFVGALSWIFHRRTQLKPLRSRESAAANPLAAPDDRT